MMSHTRLVSALKMINVGVTHTHPYTLPTCPALDPADCLQRKMGAFNPREQREATQVRAGGGRGGSEERGGPDNNKEIGLTGLFSVEILQ